jgi:hypothetical protein
MHFERLNAERVAGNNAFHFAEMSSPSLLGEGWDEADTRDLALLIRGFRLKAGMTVRGGIKVKVANSYRSRV